MTFVPNTDHRTTWERPTFTCTLMWLDDEHEYLTWILLDAELDVRMSPGRGYKWPKGVWIKKGVDSDPLEGAQL